MVRNGLQYLLDFVVPTVDAELRARFHDVPKRYFIPIKNMRRFNVTGQSTPQSQDNYLSDNPVYDFPARFDFEGSWGKIHCSMSEELGTSSNRSPPFRSSSLHRRAPSSSHRHHVCVVRAVDFWCIHPGGRRIIEEAMNGLGLTEEQASDSWAVLGEYGNMLSPSVMFVLTR